MIKHFCDNCNVEMTDDNSVIPTVHEGTEIKSIFDYAKFGDDQLISTDRINWRKAVPGSE